MNISKVTAKSESGVAVARFTVDGQARYVKAHYAHVTPEEIRRDVQKHIDYASQLPAPVGPEMLANFGEVAF